MARVPEHLLRDWIVRLKSVADARHLDTGVVEELRRLAASADEFLTEPPRIGGDDKRRGLGRGLEALIPTDQVPIASIEELRARLRRIAASVAP